MAGASDHTRPVGVCGLPIPAARHQDAVAQAVVPVGQDPAGGRGLHAGRDLGAELRGVRGETPARDGGLNPALASR